MVVTWAKTKYKELGVVRYRRIDNYLKLMEDNYDVTDESDKHTLKDINDLIDERVKALKALYVVIVVSYIGIYISVLSFMFSDVFIISEITTALSKALGFFGSTLFIITLFVSNRLNNLYYEDLSLLAAHAISIYNNYKIKAKEESIFEDRNEFITFINFFKYRFP